VQTSRQTCKHHGKRANIAANVQTSPQIRKNPGKTGADTQVCPYNAKIPANSPPRRPKIHKNPPTAKKNLDKPAKIFYICYHDEQTHRKTHRQTACTAGSAKKPARAGRECLGRFV